MFDRFTDHAKRIMALANEQARRSAHDSVEPEHILLGLLSARSNVAAVVLKSVGLDVEETQTDVKNRLKTGNDDSARKRPLSSRSKALVEITMREADDLGQNYVGAEHLLLAMLRDRKEVCAQVLMDGGVVLDEARQEVLAILGHAVTNRRGPTEKAAIKIIIRRDKSFAATINAAAEHLPSGRVTAGAMILALIESDLDLAARLSPILNRLRDACKES